MKQGKLTIPELVSKYPNEADLKQDAKRLIAEGKTTSKWVSMSHKILLMASEEDIRDLVDGKVKPTVVYDRCRGVDRSLMISKKMITLAEGIFLKSVKGLICEQKRLSIYLNANHHKYNEILDLYEAGFISKSFTFRCITLLANHISNEAWEGCSDRIRSHFEIPFVEEETLMRWEEDPERFYPKVLGGRDLTDSLEK